MAKLTLQNAEVFRAKLIQWEIQKKQKTGHMKETGEPWGNTGHQKHCLKRNFSLFLLEFFWKWKKAVSIITRNESYACIWCLSWKALQSLKMNADPFTGSYVTFEAENVIGSCMPEMFSSSQFFSSSYFREMWENEKDYESNFSFKMKFFLIRMQVAFVEIKFLPKVFPSLVILAWNFCMLH